MRARTYTHTHTLPDQFCIKHDFSPPCLAFPSFLCRIAESCPGSVGRFDADQLSEPGDAGGAGAASNAKDSADSAAPGPSWGSTLSLMLFGPLALSKKSKKSKADGASQGEVEVKSDEPVWNTWCFHDTELLTEDGVMPEVAALMHEVHAASWQARSESSELPDTDATWRFPDLAAWLPHTSHHTIWKEWFSGLHSLALLLYEPSGVACCCVSTMPGITFWGDMRSSWPDSSSLNGDFS